MNVTLEAGHGPIHVETDDTRLRIEASGMRLDVAWQDITGAGVARQPGGGVTLDPEIEGTIPLLGSLRRTAERAITTHRILLIVHGTRHHAYQVSVPVADQRTTVVLDELQARLGPRWREREYELGALKKALGARTPTWYWLVGAVFVLGIVVLLPLVAQAAGSLRDAIEQLDPTAIEPWMPVVLLVWLGLVGGLLWRVRRLWR